MPSRSNWFMPNKVVYNSKRLSLRFIKQLYFKQLLLFVERDINSQTELSNYKDTVNNFSDSFKTRHILLYSYIFHIDEF